MNSLFPPVENGGVYRTGSNYTEFITPWSELIEDGIITVDDNGAMSIVGDINGDLLVSESVKDVTGYTLYNQDKGVTGIKFSNNLKWISDECFYRSSVLTSVTLPASLISIGFDALYSCPNLTEIIYEGTSEQWAAVSIDENSFNGSGTTGVYCSGDGVTVPFN